MNFKRALLSLVIAGFTVTAFAQKRAPNGWHLSDPKTTGYYGISLDKAYQLLKGKKSQPVIVAVIDSGIDTTHEDLKPVLWTNPKEVPGNGIDDDKNGYVDDVHGWNFLGGKDGRNVGKDSYEAARVYHRYKAKFEDVKDPSMLSKDEQETYKMWVKAAKDATKGVEVGSLTQIKLAYRAMKSGDASIVKALGKEEYTIKDLKTVSPTDQDAVMFKNMLLGVSKENNDNLDITNRNILDQVESEIQKMESVSTAPPNYRGDIVKDNEADINDRSYGNNDIYALGADHGTHVSGIIGAARGNKKGMDGIADNVRIMMLRAVPDGDEHDKDVALAIRYAVDHGAKVINMSFGKGVSPEKQWVDDAVKYAESKGVLLVGAAGNESSNVDSSWHFPTPLLNSGTRAPNYITVGASAAEKNNLVAYFSNYGKGVDVFAPGVNVYATMPGGKSYANLSGTSMASPVVAGVAALIFQYYPKFTPEQVKMIIEQSAVPFTADVTHPETGEKVKLSDLSKTGAVVNAYEAIVMAEQLATNGKIVTDDKKIKVDGKDIKIKKETPTEKKKEKVKSA